MKVGCTESCPSVHDATEVWAIFLFNRGSRLKRDMCHRAVNGKRDRRLGGVARKDQEVLMEGETPIRISRHARGRGTSDGRCHTPTVQGHSRTRAVLLKKHFTARGRDVFPIDSVEILTFSPFGILAPPSRLKILDLSCSVLTNARLVRIGAADDEFSLLFLSPGMRLSASKTFAFDEGSGRIATLGGLVPS